MNEWGIFNDESADYTAEEALEAQFYSRADAERTLATYDPEDEAYVHEVEPPDEG